MIDISVQIAKICEDSIFDSVEIQYFHPVFKLNWWQKIIKFLTVGIVDFGQSDYLWMPNLISELVMSSQFHFIQYSSNTYGTKMLSQHKHADLYIGGWQNNSNMR